MIPLASQLFREVRPDFFRTLTGPLSPLLYVDALDALETEASHRSQGLDREEALAIVKQVFERQVETIAQNPELVMEGANGNSRASPIPGGQGRTCAMALEFDSWMRE
jgi:hypothetical protein